VARTFDWSSTIGIDAVYVKGGSGGSNLYVYAPTAQSPEQFSDDGLTTPGTSGNGVSHMSFCYDESNPTTTTTAPTTTTTAPTTTTTAPTTTTTAPTTTTVAVLGQQVTTTTTTAPVQVLGTQTEALAVTGAENGTLVAVSLGLIALGLGLIVLGNGHRLLVPRRR
jgi:carbohydrate-binding DOMON domain-containing protein